MQGHTCVFVHLILQFSSSQDTNTNHVQYIMYKYKEYCKDMLISMYFSSSDNTKLETFYIVTIYSFCQENMLANFFSTKNKLFCFASKQKWVFLVGLIHEILISSALQKPQSTFQWLDIYVTCRCYTFCVYYARFFGNR